jgi:hypothetical protein
VRKVVDRVWVLEHTQECLGVCAPLHVRKVVDRVWVLVHTQQDRERERESARARTREREQDTWAGPATFHNILFILYIPIV